MRADCPPSWIARAASAIRTTPSGRRTRKSPLSWVLARAVAEGRNAVNYSEWGAYSPGQQRTLLAASCDDAKTGKMPGGAWTLLHPEARLSDRDIETICAAARQVETNTARQR
jgi:Haem-binding domain